MNRRTPAQAFAEGIRKSTSKEDKTPAKKKAQKHAA
jgi:hypothetical protein